MGKALRGSAVLVDACVCVCSFPDQLIGAVLESKGDDDKNNSVGSVEL